MAEQGLKSTKASKVREDSKGFLFKVAFFSPVKVEQVLNILILEVGEKIAFGRRLVLWDMRR